MSGHAWRTRAREVALQLLYSFDQNHDQDDGRLLPSTERADIEARVLELAESLFTGFCDQRVPVDALIEERLTNWTLARMAVMDRCLLRLGTYELCYHEDTPPAVVINEYIELAKAYGSDLKTPRLVNGLLDRVRRDRRAASHSKD